MATLKQIQSNIRKIALKSSLFKIGKTGLTESERLSAYPEYKRIKTITWSKDKQKIDKIESKMIEKFINWKNNDNDNKGSASNMSDESDTYRLYVVYKLKKNK